MAKQTIRMRCTAIHEYERELIPADANAAPVVGIMRRISITGPGANFVQVEFCPEHARGFEVGGEYDVTIAPAPKRRAPRT